MNDTTDDEYNYDRMVTARSQIDSVINDMMRVLHNNNLSENTKQRMVTFLQNASDDLSRMKVTNK